MASGKKVQELLGQMQKNLECSICLDMLRNPVSTSCGHQFCRYCLLEFLERKKQVPCPLCKKPVTKRSLTERSHLGNIVDGVHKLISAFQTDTGAVFSPLRGSHHNVLTSTPESIPAELSRGKARSVRRICPTRRGGQRLQNEHTESTATGTCTTSDSPRTTQNSEVPKEVNMSSNKHSPEKIDVSNNPRAVKSTSKSSEEINKIGKVGKSRRRSSSRDTESETNKESNAHALLQIIENGDLCARQGNESKRILRVSEKNTKENELPNNIISESETTIEVEHNKSPSKRKGIRKIGKSSCEAGDSRRKSFKRTSNNENNVILGVSSHSNSTSPMDNVEESVDNSRNIPDSKIRSHNENKRGRKYTKSVTTPEALSRKGLTNECISSITTEDVTEDNAEDISDSAPLFRTPVVVKKLAKKEFDSKDTLVVRSLRSRDKQSELASKNVCEKDIDDTGSVNLTPDTEGDKISEFGVSKKEMHHTYSRKGKSAGKDVQANKKVAAWLETIMPVDDEFIESKPSEVEDPKQKTEKKKSNARFRNLKKLEESMGQKMKHLAEHIHEENKDMFGFEEIEIDVEVKENGKKVEEMADVLNLGAHSKETCDDKETQIVKKRRIFKSRSNLAVSKPTDAKEGHDALEHKTVIASDSDNDVLPDARLLPTSQRLLKLESLSQDNEEQSDPYEFKSSQRTPKKVKKKSKGKSKGQKNQKRKENIYSIAKKLKPAELKGCLKVQRKATDQEIPISLVKHTADVEIITDPVKQTKQTLKSKKAGKSNPLLLDSNHGEITKAATKIEQAEDYDLLTCTQDAVANMAAEQQHDIDGNTANGNGVKEINQKRVTFREPVISDFIHSSGKIDIIGYRKAKEHKGNVVIDGNKMNIQTADGSGSAAKNLQESGKEAVENTEMDTNDDKDSDDHSEDWRFHDDSSGTDDLEIDPEQEEFEQPNLDIQPDEVKALLSQELEATEEIKHAGTSSNVTVIEETPLVFKVPNFAADKTHSKLTRKKLDKSGAFYDETSDNATKNSPKITVIEETPLLFKVPNFGEKDISSTKPSRNKSNELKTCKDDTSDDVMVIKETPLLFSVPKFSDKSHRNGAIENGIEYDELLCKEAEVEEDEFPCKDAEIENELPCKKEETEDESAELIAVPLFAAGGDNIDIQSDTEDANESITPESVEDVNDSSMLQDRVDLRKQAQINGSYGVVEDTPITQAHDDTQDTSANAEEYTADDVNINCQQKELSSTCIDGNSKKMVTDSDLTQSPDTQRRTPLVESQRKLKESVPIASDRLVSPAIETSNSVVDSLSQNSVSILLPKAVNDASMNDPRKGIIPNSTSSFNGSSSLDATGSTISTRTAKGKRKKRKCFMLEDTPESLNFGSLAEQLPANDSEQRNITPKRRRFNRLKKGSASPGQPGSSNDVSSSSSSGRDVRENNAIEMKKSDNGNQISISNKSSEKMDELNFKSAVGSSGNSLKTPRKHIPQQSIITVDSLSQDNILKDSENTSSVERLKVLEESAMEQDKEPAMQQENFTGPPSQDSEGSVGFTCKSVDQFQPVCRISSTSSSEMCQKLSKKTVRKKEKDSFEAKNTSAIFISPEDNLSRSNSFGSPEDIFQLEGHMPTVDCSPMETLEKVELSQVQPINYKSNVTFMSESANSKCRDNEKRQKNAKCTIGDKVTNNSQNELSVISESGNRLAKRSDVTNVVEEPVLRNSPLPQQSELSPGVNKKPAVRAARGFSRRSRLSDESSSPITPIRKSNSASPRTPNKFNFQKYKSPVAKFISPKAKTNNELENTVAESNSTKFVPHCQTSPYSKYSSPFSKKHASKESPSHQLKPNPEIVDLEENDDHSNLSNSQHSLPDLQNGNDDTQRKLVSKQTPEKKLKPIISPKLTLKSPDTRNLVCVDENRESGNAKLCVVEKNVSPENSAEDFNTSRSVVPDSMPDFHNVDKSLETMEDSNRRCSITEDEQLGSSNSSSDLPLNLSSDEEENYIDEDDNEAKSNHNESEASVIEETVRNTYTENSQVNNRNNAKLNESEVSVIEETLRNTCTQNSESIIKNTRLDEIDLDSPSFEKKSMPETVEKSSGHADDGCDAHETVVMESDEEDHTDYDSAEDIVVRKKPRRSILSDSSSEDEDDSSRHMNLTSSSAFSSQSENLTTQDRVALEHDLERMAKEMAAMKEQLKKSRKLEKANFTDAMDDPKPTVIVDDDSDAIEVDNSDVEADRDLSMSPPPFSPPLMSPGEMGNASQPLPSPGVVEETLPRQSADDPNVTNSVIAVSTENMETCDTATAEPSVSLSPDVVPSRPPLADLDVNRSPARSPSPPRTNMAFAATGLTAVQLQETKRLAVQNDVKFYSKFNDSVTHVIVKPAEEDETLCDRTLKLFQGISRGSWIVSHFWVSDSLQVGRLLPEGPYEIQGDTANGEWHGGPKRSRLSKKKLLRNGEYVLIGNNSFLSRDAITDLIQACGGVVVNDLSKVGQGERAGFVVNCSDMDEEEKEAHKDAVATSNEIYKRYGIVTLAREWLLDSVTLYRIQAVEDYIITEGSQLNIPELV